MVITAILKGALMPEEATKPAEGYKYHRVLLKLSGEALMGDNGYGIDPKVIDDLAAWIARRPTISVCSPRS